MIRSIMGMAAGITIVAVALWRERQAKKNGNDIGQIEKMVKRAEEEYRKSGTCPTCHR